LAKALSTEIGVLGARLDEQGQVIADLSEDYSAFKENTSRTLKRIGMRWARSGGNGGDLDTNQLILEALRQSRKPADPFGE